MKQNNNNPLVLIPLHIITILLFSQPTSAIDFVFNGFNSSSSTLSLYGDAVIDQSHILSLTNQTSFTVGRALYSKKIQTKQPNTSHHVLSFSTSFIFAMARYKNVLPGHGLVFVFVPRTGIEGTNSAQNLGFLNRTNDGDPNNHVFGVEFDVFQNQEFGDINDNHIGIDMNSLTSTYAEDAGYWSSGRFERVQLNSGKNFQVWIDYADFVMNVTVAPVGVIRPSRPLLNVFVNLSEVFEDEMYVGFTASTGQLVQGHKILAWSFSNSDFELSDRLITTGLPSFVLPKDSVFKSKGFIAGVVVGGLSVIIISIMIVSFFIRRKRRRAKESEEKEEWELEYWPHRITYQEIKAATKGFIDENVIGTGGNGKVYKGILPGGTEVAVKRILQENDGMREFLAEISSLGRLKHKNLVGLRGWCRAEKGTLMLVYDYMVNGSLDTRIFDCSETEMLSFEDRKRILKDVAQSVCYLHEGWESKVLHRDIKASNVLLDKDMNGRLSDFGLARMHEHGQLARSTRMVGTVGYLAPEMIRTGRASTKTDVFSFGVLILEVICGRRPIEEGKPVLVDWVWQLMTEGQLLNAFDPRLTSRGVLDREELETMLHLGLLCTYPDPSVRPTMRQVAKVLEGKNETNETENEDTDTYLLRNINSEELWSNYTRNLSGVSHPNFQDIRQPQSSLISISWTSTMNEGR